MYHHKRLFQPKLRNEVEGPQLPPHTHIEISNVAKIQNMHKIYTNETEKLVVCIFKRVIFRSSKLITVLHI